MEFTFFCPDVSKYAESHSGERLLSNPINNFIVHLSKLEAKRSPNEEYSLEQILWKI